eukprot:3423704-Pyramimonas_sp.AAC.1
MGRFALLGGEGSEPQADIGLLVQHNLGDSGDPGGTVDAVLKEGREARPQAQVHVSLGRPTSGHLGTREVVLGGAEGARIDEDTPRFLDMLLGCGERLL